MELGLGGPCNTVRGPGVHEIRVIGKVGAGIDVPVLSGDDERVLIEVVRDEIRDLFGNRVATFDRQSPTLAEGWLDIHDN